MNPNEQEDLRSWQDRRSRIKAEKRNGNGFGIPLGVAVRLWPTPGAADGEGGRMSSEETVRTGGLPSGQKAHLTLGEAARYWPSPRAYSYDASHAPGLTPLDIRVRGLYPDQARSWPSPRASDGEKGGPNQHGSSGDLMVPSAELHWAAETAWPSPTATDCKGSSQPGQWRGQLAEAAEQRWPTPTQAVGLGGPGNGTREGGNNLRTAVGRLNPDWVELLVNLPVGWTDPEVPNAALRPWPGWPARPGHAQHAYEPPRTTRGGKHRARRLCALGNMVVPAQAVPIFAAIMAVEEEAPGD